MRESLIKSLGIQYPIVQAPMAGGATTTDLVVAVAKAGALGSLAAGMLSPQAVIEQSNQIKQKTDKPFLINLFVLSEAQSTRIDAVMPSWLTQLYQALNLAIPKPSQLAESFDKQFEALLQASPAVASFTFGMINNEQMRALKKQKIAVVGTVNHLEEARQWTDLGADALCVQGLEAGGHQGGYLKAEMKHALALLPLLTQCRQLVDVPLWAAGGLMTGANMVAVQALGAEAAQFGTAFLSTQESGIASVYKEKLIQADGHTKTRLTRLFSGQWARHN